MKVSRSPSMASEAVVRIHIVVAKEPFTMLREALNSRRELRRVSTMLDYLGLGPIFGILLLTVIGSWLWTGVAVIDGSITAPQALVLLSVLASLVLLAALGVRHRLGHALIVTIMLHVTVAWMQCCTHDAALGFMFVLGISFAGACGGPVGAVLAAAAALLWHLAASTLLGISGPGLTTPLVLGTTILSTLIAALGSASQYGALEIASNAVRDSQQRLEQLRTSRGELNRTIRMLDLTTARLERANAELYRARLLAEEAQRFKDELAARISHELRTPLNLILGFSETIAFSPEAYGTPLPASYRRDVLDIHRVGRHMLSLIEDILDLARLQAGRMGLYIEEVDLCQVISTAVEIVRPLIVSKRLALHVEIAEAATIAAVDQARIRQVILNLLSNAARFTSQGGITVRLDASSDEAVISVQDTGPGIAPENLGRAFEEFRQVDGSPRRQHDGAGLGLAISKELVELHGGRMWVESKVGVGSTFYFSLPISASARISRLSAPASPASGAHVLPAVLALSTQHYDLTSLLRRHLHNYQVIPVDNWLRAAERSQLGDVRALIVAGPLPEHAPELAAPILSCSFYQPDSPVILPEGIVCLEKPLSLEAVGRILAEAPSPVHRVLIISEYAETGRVLTRMVSALLGSTVDVAQALDVATALERYEAAPPEIAFVDLDTTQEEIGAPTIDLLLARQRASRPTTIIAMTWGAEGGPLRGGPLTLSSVEGLSLSDYMRTIEAILDVMYPVMAARSTASDAPSKTGERSG
jgi:signal transduction histidine kinase